MLRFNIRVYALIVNGNNEILISEERRHGIYFTKFPGGGLEWGEGITDCLKRELLEELGLPCEIGELFFVNDFFQASAFSKDDQLFSFYFKIKWIEHQKIKVVNHDTPIREDEERFRWISLDSISPNIFTFPIDKNVASN